MRKAREYAWNGYLDLIHAEVKAHEHATDRQKQHVADVIRRTNDPAFARAYAAPQPPDPEWEAREAQRRRVYALAREAGYPEGVAALRPRQRNLRERVIYIAGPACWGYWITGANPELLARAEAELTQLLAVRQLVDPAERQAA